MDSIETMIRSIVREELAVALSGYEDAPYTSIDLPPDMSKRATFARACASIPEATRTGKVWSVPRDAWARHRNAKRGCADLRIQPTETDEDIAGSNGLRVVVSR